jgi:hypothetical protein
MSEITLRGPAVIAEEDEDILPASKDKNVDLPAPEGPRTAVILPLNSWPREPNCKIGRWLAFRETNTLLHDTKTSSSLLLLPIMKK